MTAPRSADTVDLDALERAAKKATPKPQAGATLHIDYGYEELGWTTDAPDSGGYVEWSDADLRFVALADRDTLLALIAELRARRRGPPRTVASVEDLERLEVLVREMASGRAFADPVKWQAAARAALGTSS